MSQTNPALVTELAARRLPRWVLLLLGLAYVLPGLLGRDPWRQSDLSAFGAMLDLSRHPSHWQLPQVLGEAVEHAGWLPYWLGAAAIRALPFLPADLAARLPFGGLLVLTLVSTWYAMYHLARLPGAQPLPFAFGGEARPADYARALSDAALLALIASLGLALLSHESTPSSAQLAFSALLLFGGARFVSGQAARHGLTVAAWWTGALGLSLSGAPWMALALGAGWLVCALPSHVVRADSLQRRWLWIACALGSGLALALYAALAWPHLGMPDLSRNGLSGTAWHSVGRLLVWFTWPAGLLVLWTLWRWRRRWHEAQLLLPLWWLAAVLAATVWTGSGDRALLLALPAIACLAALALPTLSRAMTALIDWFALLFFSGGAIIVWTIYLAMMTGVPAKPAANVAKLAPGFQPEFSWGLLLPAILATAAWAGVLAWRIGRHRPALWKSLVLSATGGTLCWLLLMTLWLPLLNFGLGQAPISKRIAAVTPPGGCVLVYGLNHDQITGLQYHGGLNVVRWNPQASAATCQRLVLHPAAFRWVPAGSLDRWSLMQSVPRLRDNRDHLLVFELRQ